jgi:hypothetical protein
LLIPFRLNLGAKQARNTSGVTPLAHAIMAHIYSSKLCNPTNRSLGDKEVRNICVDMCRFIMHEIIIGCEWLNLNVIRFSINMAGNI